MPEYPYHCPICNRVVQLGTQQPHRKMCPECTVQQIQDKMVRDNEQHSKRYRDYLRDPSPDPLLRPPRPLTQQQLADALFDAKTTEQLKQCAHCIYSNGKGSNLFCDYVTHKGYTRNKGIGPGDCRSFEPQSDKRKNPPRRAPFAF